jgi:FkbH-like protein
LRESRDVIVFVKKSILLCPMRIAVLCSFNLDLLGRPLKDAAVRAGLNVETYFTPYGQWENEARDRQSSLHRFVPDVAILFGECADLMPPLEPANLLPTRGAAAEVGAATWQRVENAARALLASLPEPTVLLVHNLARPALDTLGTLEDNSGYSTAAAVDEFNSQLRRLAESNPRVKVIDYAGFVAQHGHQSLVDDRLWHLGRMRLGRAGMGHLAALYARYLSALLLPRRKCLVLDLDNTLWGGVLGEDGVEGIAIGQEGIGLAFREFQLALKALAQRGVLLAVASKNNLGDALEVLDHHPEMVLRRNDFACLEIHWNSKSESLARIAQQLNLGLDSFVFWDDEPREREVVRSQHPAVLVPEVPADPSEFAKAVLSLECFDVLSLTEEDRRRGEMYREESDRQQWLSAGPAADLGEFYRSLNMTVTIESPDGYALPRFAQLTQRTNQFNFTTRRYSEGDIRAKLADPAHRLYVISLEDRFGKLGVIGAAMVARQRESWRLDTFLMSCRALGRGAEDAFLATIVSDAAEAGTFVCGEFIPTKKNNPARQFLAHLKLAPDVAQEASFQFEIKPGQIAVPDWVRVCKGRAAL